MSLKTYFGLGSGPHGDLAYWANVPRRAVTTATIACLLASVVVGWALSDSPMQLIGVSVLLFGTSIQAVERLLLGKYSPRRGTE